MVERTNTSRLSRFRKNRWFRLLVGLALLAGFFAFLSTSPCPPGMAGELIQRNLRQNVQATALLYSDLDRMPEIERRLDANARQPVHKRSH
jgi:hypothetical protein